MDRFTAKGSVGAFTAATVGPPFPRSITTITSAATMTTTAAAMARGIQFRSRAGADEINSGPSLTTRILHPLLKEHPALQKEAQNFSGVSRVADGRDEVNRARAESSLTSHASAGKEPRLNFVSMRSK